MTDIKNIDLNPDEKDRIVREVYDDSPGCGVIHPGKYHILAYKPILTSGPISKSKCIGVELFIHKADNTLKQWTPDCKVLYKQSFFETKEAFKDRLQSAIKEQIATTILLDKAIDDEINRIAKEKRDREKAIEDHITHTRSCQLKIDSTIKTLAPKAKSMIEVNSERLLAAKTHTQENLTSFVENEYGSEIEKQKDANDLLLHKKINRVVPEVIDHLIMGKYGEPNMKIIKENMVECELVMPGDSNYSTSIEKNEKLMV